MRCVFITRHLIDSLYRYSYSGFPINVAEEICFRYSGAFDLCMTKYCTFRAQKYIDLQLELSER
jgi:hypothetical protein